MSPRIIAVTGAILTVLALPAAAQAAQLDQPLRPCYATTLDGDGTPTSEGITLAVSGFTPNSLVDLTIDGTNYEVGVATDETGAFVKVDIPAPYIGSGQREFTITATEQGNPLNVVTATARTTALGVSVKPAEATPSTKVRWKGRGFTADRPVYVHYVYKGKSRKTVKMTNPALGRWKVQFDQSKKYRAQPRGAFVWLTLTIFRRA